MSLRVDNNLTFVRIGTLFVRYAAQAGRKEYPARWKKAAFEQIQATQIAAPVLLFTSRNRTLWYFHEKFYWDDERLERDDVMALVLQRERRSQQKLQSAKSMMRAEASGRQTRSPIPSDLRRAVYERDGGKCVECGSTFNLQYDHILPVALGGAATLENLQLLCADCNLAKSDSL